MSYHKTRVIGHAGGDVEAMPPSGALRASFLLCVTDQTDFARGGMREVRYEVRIWGSPAAALLAHENLDGRLLLVEGVPSVEVWLDEESESQVQHIVTAYSVRFLPGSAQSRSRHDKDVSADAD